MSGFKERNAGTTKSDYSNMEYHSYGRWIAIVDKDCDISNRAREVFRTPAYSCKYNLKGGKVKC